MPGSAVDASIAKMEQITRLCDMWAMEMNKLRDAAPKVGGPERLRAWTAWAEVEARVSDMNDEDFKAWMEALTVNREMKKMKSGAEALRDDEMMQKMAKKHRAA